MIFGVVAGQGRSAAPLLHRDLANSPLAINITVLSSTASSRLERNAG
jgi:hypothetical protein